MSNFVVVVLLIAAGALGIAGTATVAINYASGVRLGREIRGEIQSVEELRKEYPFLANLPYFTAGEIDVQSIAHDLDNLRVALLGCFDLSEFWSWASFATFSQPCATRLPAWKHF